MGFMDLFKKSSKEGAIPKQDLEKQIRAMESLAKVFLSSSILRSQGMGRSEKMASVLRSYKSIFAYFYSDEFKYGSVDSLLNQDERIRYQMVAVGMKNPTNRAAFLRDLPSNWQDVLKVVNLIKIAEPKDISTIQSDIDAIGNTMLILSNL